jgi:hypothetical protein
LRLQNQRRFLYLSSCVCATYAFPRTSKKPEESPLLSFCCWSPELTEFFNCEEVFSAFLKSASIQWNQSTHQPVIAEGLIVLTLMAILLLKPEAIIPLLVW